MLDKSTTVVRVPSQLNANHQSPDFKKLSGIFPKQSLMKEPKTRGRARNYSAASTPSIQSFVSNTSSKSRAKTVLNAVVEATALLRSSMAKTKLTRFVDKTNRNGKIIIPSQNINSRLTSILIHHKLTNKSNSSTVGLNTRLSKKNIDPITKKNNEINALLANLAGVNSHLAKISTSDAALAKIAKEAIRDKKIFSIDGFYTPLSDALGERGWVQKLSPSQVLTILNACNNTLLIKSSQFHHAMDLVRLTRLLGDELPSFIWSHTNYHHCKSRRRPFFSRLIGRNYASDFATKSGLTNVLSRIDILNGFDNTETEMPIYPRSFVLRFNSDRVAFYDQFRLTFCTSFLYYLYKLDDFDDLFTTEGQITTETLEFALKQLLRWMRQNAEISPNPTHIGTNADANVFFEYSRNFQAIMSGKAKIAIMNNKTPDSYIQLIRKTVQDAIKLFPYIVNDGKRNIWILKPALSHCGKGIRVMDNEYDIRQFLYENNRVNYIAQKYIENPLLVYNTKFDMRQYFMITMDGVYFNVWMYRNCYLKFSGQEFTLDNLSRAIHVTNHSVQKNIPNGPTRSTDIPSYNMWTLAEFKDYLCKINQPNVWEDRIYSGMVHSLQTVLMACMANTEYAANAFQLFGADFMITDDYRPVLIEINSSPDLSHSTAATKQVCTAVLHDLVKVIVDNAKFSTSKILHPTGDFERILKMKKPKITRENYSTTVVEQRIQVRKEIIRRPSEVLGSKKLLSAFVANMSRRMSMSQMSVRNSISREALSNLRSDVSRLSLQYSKKKGSITPSAPSRSSIASTKKKRLMVKRVSHENFSQPLPPLYNSNEKNKICNVREFIDVLSKLMARSLMSSNREFLLNKLTQPQNAPVKKSKPNLIINVVSRCKPSHLTPAKFAPENKPASPSNCNAKVIRKTDSFGSTDSFPSSARHTLYS